MPIFTYRAKKGPQDIVEATIEARSEKEAIEKISALGVVPLHLEERRDASSLQADKKGAAPSSFRVRAKDVTVFSRQLASLLKAGVPILSALTIIKEQVESASLKAVLEVVYNEIRAGATFSSVLERYDRIFPALYIALVRTGEESGSLPDALFRVSDYRVQQEEAYSRLRMALAYPVLMGLVGLGTIIFMLTFVIPRISAIFLNMGQELPLPTRIVVTVSGFLGNWWFWAVMILVTALVVHEFKAPQSRLWVSRLKLSLPLLGKIILKADLARFSRTFELLLRSGITVLKALETAVSVVDNEVVKVELKKSYQALEQGGSFGRSLKEKKIFPAFMSNLIIVGEQSGKLNDSLSEIAGSYERDTDEAVKIMTNLLEPGMILAMGLVVGFLVVAMLLPIFEMNALVR